MADKYPTSSDKTRKTLDLSPEARASLRLPLEAGYANGSHCIRNADGLRVIREIGTLRTSDDVDAELAAFIAALVNAALTPAAPVVTIIPEDNAELRQLITTEWEAAEQPVRMCAVTDCMNAADPTSRHGYCLQHAAARWTAEQMIEREG